MLLAGTARASHVAADGREVVVAVYRAVVAFDKLALLDGGPHPATVVDVTDVTVSYLPATVVRELVTSHPPVATQLLRARAGMVRE